MDYSKKFKLVPDTNPYCDGCCFNKDGCNLQAELGGGEFIEEFDNQVGSCVTAGGLYKLVQDTGLDKLTYNFIKSSYN